jgi:DNA-binding response OmpR family regulator
VEDDTQVRLVAERALTAAGYSVLTATDPLDAMVVFERHRGALHLLLTDITMPGGNGHDLALQVRARYQQARVLYISGYTETAISRRGILPAGAAMLPKPFTPATLVRRVREVLDEQQGAEEEGADSALGTERPLVMVIDDDEFVRRALKRHLRDLGCDVLLAPDSDHAVEMACEARPAAILLDLHMPGVDGHTLLRRLPAAGVEASIIVMSGEGDADDVIGALRAGAVDYLKKPWATDGLASSVRHGLEVFRAFTGRPA